MAWSIDNPVVGEFEDLIPQPLPYRMVFLPADQLPEPAALPPCEPIVAAPAMLAVSSPTLSICPALDNATENPVPSAAPYLSPAGTSLPEPDTSLSGCLALLPPSPPTDSRLDSALRTKHLLPPI